MTIAIFHHILQLLPQIALQVIAYALGQIFPWICLIATRQIDKLIFNITDARADQFNLTVSEGVYSLSFPLIWIASLFEE